MDKPTIKSLQQLNLKLEKKLTSQASSLKRLKWDLKIETSLERMRTVAMNMRKQDDSSVICETLFIELRKFDFSALRNTQIIINNDDHATFLNYDYSDYAGASKTRVHFASHAKTKDFIARIKERDDAFVEFVIGGDELEDWRNWRIKNGEPDDAKIADIDTLYYYFYSIGRGAIGISTFKPISAKELTILKRFRNAFGLAYRRFMDVRLAEEQAREAQIELGLERVRTRAMAMQKSDDLGGAIAIVFEELDKLKLDIFRCGIGIINREQRTSDLWTTTKSDNGVMQVSGDESMDIHPMLQGVYRAWLKQEDFNYVLQGADLNNYYKALTAVNFKLPASQSWVSGHEEVKQYHFNAIFPAGGLFAFRESPFPDEAKNILRRFAHVFNLTYTRFNDLKLAERQAEQAGLDLIQLHAEKKRAEEALKELKATQTQLIQAEKMASLGELTAGIAHEIQNPLNFVNNFSEVSTELIEEMNAEIKKGDMQEATVIASDIRLNLEKITHHGKRADAIVKSMLQHSRRSAGIKEPTNINLLADEYLRLAYHGLRAKEMSFNATLKTDFDETIAPVDVISQDLGRVILNLITNAFYAVSEKMKTGIENYEPTVSVSTKKSEGFIEIRVADNGDGIPPHVLDKIFQPFFTTKPTGQGTGLGLSLSYDIVKAHGGQILVESKPGEGTGFVVQLPSQ
ncbi:MAG TPA: ATP-binding protein [Puia sp.]